MTTNAQKIREALASVRETLPASSFQCEFMAIPDLAAVELHVMAWYSRPHPMNAIQRRKLRRLNRDPRRGQIPKSR